MEDNVQAQQETTETTGAMIGEPWVTANLLGNLSPDYRPGPEEDFYVFVNHDWLNESELDQGELQNRPAVMEALHQVQDRCTELLAEGNSEESDIRSVQNYYALMRDWDCRDKTGVAPLDEALARIDAVTSIDELSELLTDPDPQRRLDLLTTMTQEDILDGSKYAAYADMDACNIHKDPAEFSELTPAGGVTLQVTRNVFLLIAGQTCIADRAEAIFDASLAYQTDMAAHFPTMAELAQPGKQQEIASNRMTKAELIDLLGTFPTEKVLEAHGYGDVDEFVVGGPESDAYVASQYNQERLEDIKAFLMTTLVKRSSHYLTKDIYAGAKRTYAEATGTEFVNDEKEQRREAFDEIFESLPSPVSKLYVSRYADEQMRSEIRGICEDIVAVYKDMLKEEDWLSEQTRAYAIEKLDAMKFRVLFPDTWEDYSALDIRSAAEGETLWSAHNKVKAFKKAFERSKLGTAVDSDIMPACIETNCNYNPTNNSVNIYVGYLSNLTYQSDMPLEEKLGALGMIIGHEISHAFDTTGMLYDKHGVTNDWWTDEDRAAFEARAQKAMDWYEKVYKPLGETMEGMGVRCVGETIADLGSLSVAMTLARNVENFDYDKFFRANARVWRRLDNDYAFNYMIFTDEHPMDNLRVNLTLAQCDKFHETYGVKEGNKMYFAPEDRLRVW